MNRHEIRDLAAVYALGGLPEEDRARFEALLQGGDADATAALREFEDTLVTVATQWAQAPPLSAKSALMARIDAEVRGSRSIAAKSPSRSRRVFWPVLWAATMAAGIAAIAVGLSVSASYQKRLDVLAREATALQTELGAQQQVIALLRDPSTEIIALAGLERAPGARARMLWNASSGGLLVTAGLPPAPPGKVYQLWAIAGKSAPVSAGVFDVDARGAGSLRVPALGGIQKVDVFAVTLEPAGGLPAPSGPMYLAGKS
jgi:anti-sigma-K factor RskA